MIWNIWSKDPIKAAVLRALLSCQVRLGRSSFFDVDIVDALSQFKVGCVYFIPIYGKWRTYVTKKISGPYGN